MAECSITLQQNGKKERSNSADRYLGINKRPLSVDIKDRECVFEIGLNKFDIYAGVKLLSALYEKTALLYLSRFGIDSQLKGIIPVYIFYHYYPGLSYVENDRSIYFDKATLISP